MLNNVKEPDMQIQQVDPYSTIAKAPTIPMSVAKSTKFPLYLSGID